MSAVPSGFLMTRQDPVEKIIYVGCNVLLAAVQWFLCFLQQYWRPCWHRFAGNAIWAYFPEDRIVLEIVPEENAILRRDILRRLAQKDSG